MPVIFEHRAIVWDVIIVQATPIEGRANLACEVSDHYKLEILAECDETDL